MRQHIDIVAWLHIGFGILGLGFAFLGGAVLGALGLLSGDAEAAGILMVIGGFVVVFAGLLSVPSLVAGWGLLRRKHWARMLTLILSFLNLLNFPIGTLMGGYSMWVLMNDESRRILESGDRYTNLPR